MPAINSLGFQAERTRACAAVTAAWLTRPVFEVDGVAEAKGGCKILGCGPFVIDSYYLFVKSRQLHNVTCGIYDVVNYGSWLRRQRVGSGEGAEKEIEEEEMKKEKEDVKKEKKKKDK